MYELTKRPWKEDVGISLSWVCQQLAAKTYVSLVPFAGTAAISGSRNLVLKTAE